MYYLSSALNIFPVTCHPQRSREGALLVPDRLFKVVLVGNSSVGKTSLLRSFCEGRFHPSTIATVGEKKKEKHCHHIVCVRERKKTERAKLFWKDSGACRCAGDADDAEGDLASHERA